ncbi:DUF7508 domain-containing protein [Halegenticoccus soli]|uniref:DUF7508 domain-containing protein n=1 Tax=Halegenticoccus soli TaxID=1985678 RepID=UPI000C6ED7D8|nr:hypothetical protein [Halegenticoccus soli]
MSLRKRWRDLDGATVRRAPDRYGVYELGDEEGTVVDLGVGVLRDELKDALAYGTAAKVRWEEAASKEHAERIADEHR